MYYSLKQKKILERKKKKKLKVTLFYMKKKIPVIQGWSYL